MKKRLFLFMMMLTFAGFYCTNAQTLTPTVVSSSGGYYSTGSVSLSYTVAEMTMVQTFTTSGNILTQGFQQPEDYTVGIQETPELTGDFLVYPNPTSGKFTVSFASNETSETTIRIYNLVGQDILAQTVTQTVGNNVINFDLSDYSQGIYMLEFSYMNVKGEKVTKYQKINLVY